MCIAYRERLIANHRLIHPLCRRIELPALSNKACPAQCLVEIMGQNSQPDIGWHDFTACLTRSCRSHIIFFQALLNIASIPVLGVPMVSAHTLSRQSQASAESEKAPPPQVKLNARLSLLTELLQFINSTQTGTGLLQSKECNNGGLGEVRCLGLTEEAVLQVRIRLCFFLR